MRYLRISAIIIFVASVLFAAWANRRYNSQLNTDEPEISSTIEVLEISVDDDEKAIFDGLTASDATDGDLTDSIMVASVSHFLEPGTVKVKYVVFDSHNNSASLTRRVRYTDYKSPEFSLEKAPVYTVGKAFDLLNYVTVVDGIDGDISQNVRVISNMVNNFTAGIYPVTLEVSNSCGDTSQITFWVTYLNTAPTAIVQLKQYVLYLPQGSKFQPEKWVSSVTDLQGATLDKGAVTLQGNLDTTTPGTYQLTYAYDQNGLVGQAPFTVVVTEKEG